MHCLYKYINFPYSLLSPQSVYTMTEVSYPFLIIIRYLLTASIVIIYLGIYTTIESIYMMTESMKEKKN